MLSLEKIMITSSTGSLLAKQAYAGYSFFWSPHFKEWKTQVRWNQVYLLHFSLFCFCLLLQSSNSRQLLNLINANQHEAMPVWVFQLQVQLCEVSVSPLWKYHIDSELPKVLIKVPFWALFGGKELFWVLFWVLLIVPELFCALFKALYFALLWNSFLEHLLNPALMSGRCYWYRICGLCHAASPSVDMRTAVFARLGWEDLLQGGEWIMRHPPPTSRSSWLK